MKKGSWIAIAVILVLTSVLGMNYRAVTLVLKNLTVEKNPMPNVENWNGGTAYLKVPYSDVSENTHMNLYVPDTEEAPPLFVLIHGGGFIFGNSETEQIQRTYSYFRDHGYACASINYRLAQEAAFPAAVDDCKAAIRYLRVNAEKYGYDARKIAVYGESAGGYLALMCAVTSDEDFHGVTFIGQGEEIPSAAIDVLIDYYGYTSLTGLSADLKEIGLPKLVFTLANSWTFGNLMGYEDFGSTFFHKNISEMTETERNERDPLYYLTKNREEISKRLNAYLIHGDSDMTIPLPSSIRLEKAFTDAMGKDRVFLRIEPGMGHASDPLYREDILTEIDGYIRSHM